MAGITSAVEICPFCKKPFKRLKSHLPHCKMAGDADSRNVLPPSKKAGKKKEQIKSTETTSKKENKKNKVKATTHSLQPQEIAGSASCRHQHSVEGAQKQIKRVTEKAHKIEGTNQGASEDVQTQSAEKVFSATKLAKKSPTVQKSRSKPTPNEEESASSLPLKPLNQNGRPTLESPSGPSQTTNPSTKQRQRKEASAKPDSFTDNFQPIPQRFVDTVELVIENHRVRILRNKCESPVQNIPLSKAVVGNQKAGCWPAKSPSGDAEIALADGQQIITEPVGGKSTSGLELSGNIWSGETKKNVTTAWNGYYNRYINVKKNSVAGISILLLGCVLSYAWSYPHIKHSR